MRRVLVTVALGFGLVGGLTGGLAGCASPTGTPEPAAQSPFETPTATADPAGPTPSTPVGMPAPSPSGLTTTIASDELPAGVVVGTVTMDSGGPCYLVETDDGQRYALVGSGPTVHRGQRVRAMTEQRPSAVDCGPGIQLALVKLEVS